jgi:TonB-dependent starch-binding outer membrane protein SusC
MRWKLVVITAATVLFATGSATAQTRIVTGRVIDSLTSEVVTSGQVSVQGTTIGSAIGDDGTFTVAAPNRDVVLTVRSIGFKRKDIPVPATANSVQLALERDFFQLEAIVVTGQATGVERKNLANSVASVTAEQLVKSSSATVEQSLMGKVASAQIQDLGGGPGGGVLVTLRGTTSLNNAYTPLYVVDGIVVSDAKVPRGINNLTRAAGGGAIATDQEQPINRIGDLNPEDIASVEVLKGGSASAIYGSRASNGVILITTKRGRVGTPQFTVSQGLGFSRMFRKVGGRIFETQTEAIQAFGAQAGPLWSSAVYDHDEEIAGNKPLHYQTDLSVSGGTESTKYFASALMRHEGGIVTGTYANKESFRLNIDQSVGNRVKLSVSTTVAHNGNDRGLTGNDNTGVSLWAALTSTPSFFDLRPTCPDGQKRLSCEGAVYPVNPFSTQAPNPLQTTALQRSPETVWRSIVSSRMTIDLISSVQHSLQLIGTGGIDIFNQKNIVYSPPELQYEALDGLRGTYVLSFAEGLDKNLGGSAVHRFTTPSFNATTSVGAQFEDRGLHVSRTMAENLIGGIENAISGTQVKIDEQRQPVKNFGMFAQEEVLFKEKLLLTVGGRWDQSSNNSDTRRLHFYPKAAASYRFARPVPNLIDELKIRAAIGEAGNEPTYDFKFSSMRLATIGGTAAYELSRTVSDADVRPERSREIEAGFDGTFLGSRANLEFTVYQKRISDLLLTRSLAPVTGYTTQVFNGGVMRTRGLEIGLGVLPVQSSKVQWNSRFNFFLSRSKIMQLPVPPFRNETRAKYGTLQIEQGKSPTQVLAWELNASNQRVDSVIGDYNPDFKLGWSNEVNVAGLRFYFLLDRYQGGWIHNYTETLYDFVFNTKDYDEVLPSGELKGAERLRLSNSCSRCAWMQPMTSTKLREATISYELPAGFVRNIWSGARYVRLSLSGRNLLILTGYRGGDPEVLVRATTLFRQWRSDIWPYPPFRSFWFNVNVGF